MNSNNVFEKFYFCLIFQEMQSQSENFSNEASKLKILALHGYRQNADVFKAKTGSFRKILNKYAKFTYITAPHKIILVADHSDLGDETGMNIGQSTDEGKKRVMYIIFFNENSKKGCLSDLIKYGNFIF